jgi:PAS domain S-box-containing protein
MDHPGSAATSSALEERVRELERECLALRESEARLRAALEVLPAGVWFTDATGRIVLGNGAGQRIWAGARYVGVAQYGEYRGWWADTGERIEAEEWALARALKGETSLEEVVEIECFDGTRKTILNSAVPVRDGGTIVGAVVVNLDVTAQKRTERELQHSLERLRYHTENSPLAVVERSADFHITTWNAAAERVFGWTAAEALGKRTDELQLVHPDDRARVAEVVAALASGASASIVSANRNVRKDGRVIHCQWYNSALHDASGRLVSVLSLALDVTERKEAEEAARASEQRATARAAELQTVLDTVPVAVWIARDPRGDHIEANRVGFELLRLPPGSNTSVTAAPDQRPMNFRPMKDGAEVPPDDLPIQAAARFGRDVRDFEFDLVFDDGTTRHLLGNSSPLLGADGRPRGSVGAFLEITERKQAERLRREQEEKYRNLFENMTEEVHLWRVVRDAQGRILTWRLVDANPPTLATWGRRTVEEIRGKTTEEIFGPGATDHYMAVVQKVMSEGVPHSYEDYFPNLDKHFRFTTIPLGEFFITTGADVTSIKKAQLEVEERNQALREADRRKDEFLGMLSHELRNPLAPIRNSVHVLKHSEPGSERARRSLAIIERQTEHLTRLVDDLLDVTRIARGKVELHRSRIDLRALAARSADDFKVELEARGVAFRTALPEREVWTYGDPTRLSQVFGNLLHNAAKFTPSGGEVTLSLCVAGGAAEIRVVDTGVGIAPALLPHVFEPFVQGERTLARSEGGLGLGLPAVKGIVELHGGSVRAASAGEGKGAEVAVTLPLSDAGGATP